MRYLILFLSFLALIISVIWMFKTNFDWEPIIVFIMGISGILSQFLKPKKGDVKTDIGNLTTNVNKNKNIQNISVNVNTPQTNEDIKQKVEKVNYPHRDMIVDSMKPKIQILFIDDDKNFNVVKILKGAGWKNTKSIVDIKNIDMPILKETNIFFVDINGVGKILELNDEGLDIALMLKQKYPDKKVVIYSANNKNNVFHKAWEKCDFKLEKNALPYQFQSLVEQYSIEFYKE